uniref:UDP glucuronosyltransferase 5 family, polypeptide D1 n=1 Tax=Seriola lalandi dorsalis TaxID=1841481 RepID=A0A3B4YK78_SERLL
MPLHCVCGIFTFLSVCLISFTTPCNGGNILVFPVDGSHWVNMKILLEELHARGHNITVIRASTSWYIAEKSPLYTSITIAIPMDEGLENFFDDYLQENMRVSHSIWSQALVEIFDDENMIKSLMDSQYDFVLTDPAMAPGVLLAKYLKLPLVLNVRWITSGEGHFAIAPSPLSYIPVPGSGLTDKMNFMQRIKNMFFYSIILFQQKFIVGPSYDALCDKYIEDGCDIIALLQEADIWLFRSDFVFDFPRPTMPNVVYIGGFKDTNKKQTKMSTTRIRSGLEA